MELKLKQSSGEKVVRGVLTPKPAAERYILFHKPFGVLSQFTPDHPGQRTLADFALPPGIYAAGRLDKDSEGLLLLTNDGPLIKELLDPECGHERTYLIQVEGTPTHHVVDALALGLPLPDYDAKPAKGEILAIAPDIEERIPPIRTRKSIPTTWMRITLTEGKNRQVRRMMGLLKFPVLRLIRTSIGNLKLEGIELGSWKEIQREEIDL
jgi:23S rRNA pseudouridine2457 synthase